MGTACLVAALCLWAGPLQVASGSGLPAGLAGLRLNELDACQAGIDAAEFVELGGAPGLVLDDVWLVLFNGSGEAPFPAYRAVSLAGRTLPGDGLLVIGAASVPGVDLPVFAGNAVQNGPDVAALYHAPGLGGDEVLGSAWPAGPPGAVRLDALLHVTGDALSSGLAATLEAGVAVADEAWLEAAGDHSLQRMDTGALLGGEPDAPFFAQPPTPGAPNGWALPAAIHDVQGAASVSPLEGRAVAGVAGVITRGGATGFHLQAADDEVDGDERPSEALFVRTDGAASQAVWAQAPANAAPGVRVIVDGGVLERRSHAGDLPRTELVASRIVSVAPGRDGMALPHAVVLGPGGRWPPTEVIEDDIVGTVGDADELFQPHQDGLDFFESLEGMRVRLVGARAVGPRDGGGQVVVTLAGGRASTGVNTRGGLTRRPGDANPERIPVRVGLAGPPVHVGDRWEADLVGVLDDTWGGYAVFPDPGGAGPIPGAPAPEVTTLGPACADELRVASFNVANLAPTTPPGRWVRVARLIAGALGGPDLLALQEIQDDSGPLDDGVTSAGVTLALLVDAIEAAGGPRYDAWEVAPLDGADGGQPGGNIRVALLVAPDRGLRVVERGRAGPTDAVAVVAGPDGPQLSLSPGRLAPLDPAFWWSRKPLAVELAWRGRPLFVVVNHFNSKSGDAALYGAQQPPGAPTAEQRVAQAQVVAGFVDGILALDAQAPVIVLGDLNDGDASDTLAVLTRTGLVDLVTRLPPLERYTHLYRGQGEALDHVLVSAPWAPGAELDVVHAAAEYEDGASDHDPVLVTLRPVATGFRAPRPPGRCWPTSRRAPRRRRPRTACRGAGRRARPRASDRPGRCRPWHRWSWR